ncbi:hypothetical protein [Cellulosimicrobium cellulans]|uniref:hypothetical protein n=1 Tax=Cellulosimicrobium cellulans TaxID=1710 RepID=UPI0020CF5144|nr:hypothetical protein NMQ07_00865 [Cellulosimicrobium cellulans]
MTPQRVDGLGEEAQDVHRRLVEHAVRRLRDAGRAITMGITGADASGKSSFAGAVCDVLRAHGQPFQLVHVDDFLRPRRVRYAGDLDEAEKYLNQSYDFDPLVEHVLVPVRRGGEVETSMMHLDVATDRYEVERRYRVRPGTLVVLEGVFLLRPELRRHLDFLVFLDAPDEELEQRGTARDAALLGQDVTRRFREKYLPAQRRLMAQYPPRSHADVIIDNTDWREPRILWGPR